MTYDSIVKGFAKTIEKLDRLADANEGKANANFQKISELELTNKMLGEETLKAVTTATKLRELLGV